MSTRQFKSLIDDLVQLAKAKEQIEAMRDKAADGKGAFDAALAGIEVQAELKVDELEGQFVPRELFDKLYGKAEEELLTSKDQAVRDIAVAIHEDREAGKQREIERRKKKERLAAEKFAELKKAKKSQWSDYLNKMSKPNDDDEADLLYDAKTQMSSYQAHILKALMASKKPISAEVVEEVLAMEDPDAFG
jgi:hypothetical protein